MTEEVRWQTLASLTKAYERIGWRLPETFDEAVYKLAEKIRTGAVVIK
jgi:translation initiation factor 2 alpha subunit (eIF-2alpha)